MRANGLRRPLRRFRTGASSKLRAQPETEDRDRAAAPIVSGVGFANASVSEKRPSVVGLADRIVGPDEVVARMPRSERRHHEAR